MIFHSFQKRNKNSQNSPLINSICIRKRMPKAPAQNKEKKKSEKRKPQAVEVSDESEEELESEVNHVQDIFIIVVRDMVILYLAWCDTLISSFKSSQRSRGKH